MVRHAICTAGIVLALTASAPAETVYLDWGYTGLGHSVQWSNNGGASFNSNFAGQLIANLDDSNGTNGTVGGVPVNGEYTMFCTELVQGAGDGIFEVVDVGSAPVPGGGMGATKAQGIVDIYHDHSSTALATSGGGGTNNFSAAFQIAIWEIAHDYDGTAASLNLSGGTFEVQNVNATTMGHVATILNSVGLGHSMPGLYALVLDGRQDMIILVPLPPTALLGVAGLGGLIWLRRRK